MKHLHIKSIFDDRGSSLVAVIVCVSLVGILGLTMLMMAFVNLQMKNVDRNSKKDFYDAETAVNEISTGLQNVSEISLTEAMQYTETCYSSTPEQVRTTLLNRKYASLFYQALSETAGTLGAEELTKAGLYREPVGTAGSADDRFFSYLRSMTTAAGVTVTPAAGLSTYIAYNKADSYVEIQNLTVTYNDTNDFQTSITTDIRFTPPDDYFSSEMSGSADIMDKFAVIADGSLISSGSSNQIAGSLYGGTGIAALNGDLAIKGVQIISRGTFGTQGAAKISVAASGSAGQPEIWVRNIKTSRSDSDAASTVSADLGTNLDLSADCYVADDLIMNNAGYGVRINGSYYGYHTGSVQDSASIINDGSAVAINAPHASLDIASAEGQTLLLAGRNVIDVNGDADSRAPSVQVKEGESLTYKWTQDAYLIPGSCVSGGQNPMPASLFNAQTSDGTQTMKLDFSSYPYISQINIEEYLDPVHPYIAKYVQQYTGTPGSASQNVVYLYMNFIDDNSASSFFAKYTSYMAQRSALSEIANMLGFGRVQLNDRISDGAGLYTGNIVTFDKAANGGNGISLGGGFHATGNVTGSAGATDPFRSTYAAAGSGTITNTVQNDDTGINTSRSVTPYGGISIMEKNKASYDPDVLNNEIQDTYCYNGLISVLSKSSARSYPSYELVSYLLKTRNISATNVICYPDTSSAVTGTDTSAGAAAYLSDSLAVSGSGAARHITISSSSPRRQGILIADCDVHIVNTTFTGMIITTGNVYLDGDAVVQTGDGISFAGIASDAGTAQGERKTGVSFINWRKN